MPQELGCDRSKSHICNVAKFSFGKFPMSKVNKNSSIFVTSNCGACMKFHYDLKDSGWKLTSFPLWQKMAAKPWPSSHPIITSKLPLDTPGTNVLVLFVDLEIFFETRNSFLAHSDFLTFSAALVSEFTMPKISLVTMFVKILASFWECGRDWDVCSKAKTVSINTKKSLNLDMEIKEQNVLQLAHSPRWTRPFNVGSWHGICLPRGLWGDKGGIKDGSVVG